MTISQNTAARSELSHEKFQTTNVITLFGAHFIHDTCTAFVAPLLPIIMEKFSLSLTMVGTLTALQQLPSIINPLIGYLAEKLTIRYFVILAPAITATLICSLGLASDFASLAVILFFTGFSNAVFHAPAPAMVSHVSGNRIGKGMSFFMAGGELGRTIGPLLAIWVVSLWTLEGLPRIAVIGWAASLLLLWRLKNVEGNVERSGNFRILLPKLKTLFLPLGIILFLRQFIQVGLSTYLPTFLNMEGQSLFLAGASLSILEIAGVGGALISGTLSDRVGRRQILMISISISTILIFLLLNFQGWLTIVLLVPLGFTALSTGPVFLALVQDNTPNNRAVGNGIYMSLSFVLRSLVMFLVGFAGDFWGLRTVFYFSGVLSFLSIPFIFFLPKETLLSGKNNFS